VDDGRRSDVAGELSGVPSTAHPAVPPPDRREVEDPVASLSPTARRLVAAARRVLARGGFEALTVEAVAAEAGAYRDAVRYYFGDKAAFVATVVDSLAHDQTVDAFEKTRGLPIGAARVHALVDGDRELAEDTASFRDFFTIVPHALRDEELRPRVAALYDWYRDLYVRSLADGVEDEVRARLYEHAHLMSAVTDGLALQKALDPERVDLERLFALWERMLRASLEELLPR
jgi:AcrR family transcriptional regulator